MKTKFKKFFLVIALVVIGFIGCDDSSGGSSSVVPVEIAGTWTREGVSNKLIITNDKYTRLDMFVSPDMEVKIDKYDNEKKILIVGWNSDYRLIQWAWHETDKSKISINWCTGTSGSPELAEKLPLSPEIIWYHK